MTYKPPPPPPSLIVKREVVSAPSAAIKVTELTLSDEAREGLTVSDGVEIPPATPNRSDNLWQMGFLAGFVWGIATCMMVLCVYLAANVNREAEELAATLRALGHDARVVTPGEGR